MSDWKEDLVRMGFDRDQLDLSELFVGHVFTLLEIDRRNAAPLRRGIEALAAKVNTIVPQIEEGKLAGGIGPEDLEEAMRPIRYGAIMTFIEIAGTLMLKSQDGPMGSKMSLKKVIEEVEEKLDGGETQ